MSQNENPEPIDPISEDVLETSSETEDQNTQVAENQDIEGNDPLEAIRKERDELKDKYLRLLADFDNYKKRVTREKLDLLNTAAQDTLSALMPVLDDFDRAKRIADQDNSPEPFTEGIQLLYHKLYHILRQKGLEPMESNHLAFDAERHEAITEIPAPTEDLKGKVVDTVEKGYLLHGKIIRYAKVVVGK